MKRYKDLLADNLTSPMKMELFTGDADGGNAKQITNFGCASFAPTFTPDDRKIPFSSNKHDCDGRKFELYHGQSGRNRPGADYGFRRLYFFSRVLAGRKEARVCFRPNDSTQRYEFNIFTADWK